MTLVNFNNKTRNTAPYFNNVFDSLFTDALTKNYSINKLPNVNILDSDAAFKIEIAAPGLEKDDFQISVKKGVLSVWAEKKVSDEEAAKAYTRKEFDYHSFARSFNLSDNADAEQISATYINGILTITISKVAEQNAVKEIKVL